MRPHGRDTWGYETTIEGGPAVRLTRAPPLRVRPADPAAGAARPRSARGRAAVHPRRHGDRRSSRPLPARGARSGRDGALGARDVQLPPVRDDRAGRASGGRRRGRVARRLGAQALWLSLGVGVVLAATIALLAAQIVALVGVEGQTAEYATTYLRIVSIGVPSFFLALGGQGFLRGVSDLTSPLVVIVLGNVLNLALEVLFVYGFDWGIEGSAWGTALAQSCMGLGFVWLIVRRVGRSDLGAGGPPGAPPALGRQVHLRTHHRADLRVPARRRGRRALRGRRAGRVPDLLPALAVPRPRARRDRDRGPDHRRAGARRREAWRGRSTPARG